MIKNIYAFFLILTLELIFNNYTYAQTGKWTQLFPLNSPPARYAHGLASLGNGKLLLFGGAKSAININDTWIYDLTENNWTEVNCSDKPTPRIDFAMSNIDDGKVILFGGNSEEGYSNETWLFDINKMNWEKININKSPSKREATSFAYLGDNQMLIFSGHPWKGPEKFIPDTWIFNYKKMEWDSIEYDGTYPQDRWHGMMSTINENSILLYGGFGNGNIGGDVNDTWIFDKNKKAWSIIYPKNTNKKRSKSSMAQLDENFTLVFGGDIRSNDNSKPEDQWGDDTWIYDGINNTWIELLLDTKPEGRYVHSLAQIEKGKVLLFGGETSHSTLNDTWLFEFEPNSVFDNSTEEDLKIKINSAKELNIFVSNVNAGTFKLDLIDLQGRVLKTKDLKFIENTPISLNFNVSDIPTGVYFIKIFNTKICKIKKLLIF